MSDNLRDCFFVCEQVHKAPRNDEGIKILPHNKNFIPKCGYSDLILIICQIAR